MSEFKSIILAFRPKTLTAALVPCVAGTALCHFEGVSPSYAVFFYALLSAICIQIGTNLVNDAMDFKKGADTEHRIGPTRITQKGVMTYYQVLGVASLFFLMAILLGIPLVIKGGWVIVIVGLLSVLMGYAYTSGPFPLAYVGLGDLFVILFFGLVAVMGIHYLHVGNLEQGLSVGALILGLQIGFLGTVLIAINNLRDMYQDQRAHKKTLAVRFGEHFVRWEISLLVFATFGLNFYWWSQGGAWTFLLPLMTFPLAGRLLKNIWSTPPSPEYNHFLAQAALLQVLFGFLLSVGFVL